MAFCSQCGKPTENGSRFCTFCGAPLDAAFRTQNGAAPEKKEGLRAAFARIGAFWNSIFGIMFRYKDTTYSYKKEDRQQNRYVSMLSYLNVLVLVPLVSMRESPFTQYHANLGLNLLIWEIAAQILFSVLLHFFGGVFLLGILLYILAFCIAAFFVVLSVFGIVSALRGTAREPEAFSRFRFIH